jgi:chromosomal replication initiator protein
VETKVNAHTFHSWFHNTALVRDEGGAGLVVQAPNQTVVDWLTRHYSGVIAEALAELGRAGAAVTFVAADQALDGVGSAPGRVSSPVVATRASATEPALRPAASGPASAEPARIPAGNDDDASPAAETVGLSPRYTFETFIVGASNQFAHAAARAVAETPSRSYNPLYIYGGVGLGKTHLMHAIGDYVLKHNPTMRLTYVSGERFMNEVVNALRYDRILEFRERYRTVDILLVDDVQFIAGKERTQTEFFHTFNALHDAQKQIVLSSDVPPHQIAELEERMRSRFEWGLIADIQSPDLETKVAILKRKADSEGVPLPDNVALYIAGRIKSNIRELEGALIRLLAWASLTGKDLSLALAQEVLRDVLNHDEKAVTIDMIQKFVADYYQLKLTELKSRNNSKSVAMPRQVAMYLCKQLTNASLPEIGKSFGGKHHSTVIHSIKKVEEMRQKDSQFNSLINTLTESFR